MNNSCKVELINLHVLTKQFSPFVVGSCAIKSRDMKKTTKKKKTPAKHFMTTILVSQ